MFKKQTFSMNVQIEFVGVWDTVDSVGIIPKHVPFTKYNTCVKTFRHALSLDEHRVKFKANLYHKVITQNVGGFDCTYTPFSTHMQNFKKKISHWMKHIKGLKDCDDPEMHKDKYNKGAQLQDRYTDRSKRTDVLEVWFAGCHTGMTSEKPAK